MARYLTPGEAAKELGISRATITRCKQMGAPVRYFGTCGRIYRVDPEELAEWMDRQGRMAKQKKSTAQRKLTIEEMRARRHAACG